MPQCGLTVEPDDPTALAAAIRTLRALTPSERAQLGANGRAYVERVHSYASLAALYLPVLGDPDAVTDDARERFRSLIAETLGVTPDRVTLFAQGTGRALRDPPRARHRARRRGDPAGVHVRGRPERDPLHGRPAGLG